MKAAVDNWKLELTAAVVLIADLAQQSLSSLPPEVRDNIPHATTIAMVIGLISLTARLVKHLSGSKTPAESPMAANKKAIGGLSAAAATVIAAVFAVEGGYVNNPKDPGGETNHGITKAVAVEHGYTGPMRDLPKELAASIYFEDYIKRPGFEPFLTISPAIAEELVDSGVNTGVTRPSRWLQQSLNALNRNGKDFPSIYVDGKVGPGTVAAYQSLVRVRGKAGACQLVLKLMDSQQAVYYMNLEHLGTFTPGWVANRIGNVPLSHCDYAPH